MKSIDFNEKLFYHLTFLILHVIHIFFTTDSWKSTLPKRQIFITPEKARALNPACPTVWSFKTFLIKKKRKKNLAIKCTEMIIWYLIP